MADAAQQEKRRRLNSLETFRRKVPHVSQRALSAILTTIKAEGLPELVERKDIRAARNELTETNTEYGPLHQTVDAKPAAGVRGNTYLNVIHPLAFLAFLFTTCAAFSAYFEELHDRNPSSAESPWNLIMYSDEVTPGNQLTIKNDRKLQVVYYSFKEFGYRLADENVWFTCVGKRSSKVADLDGGMSQVFGILLKLLFVSHAFTAAGCAFTLSSGRRIRLYAKLDMMLQDGGAHKVTWHCKGDGGHKFCLLCRNHFSRTSEVANADDEGTLVCDVIHASRLDLATSDELIDACRKVHMYKRTLEADEFETRSKALGFTYMGYNLLCDRELDGVLDPAKQYCSDWMHCLFVGGVWNITLQLTLHALQTARAPDVYQRFASAISQWNWPARMKQSRLEELFSLSRRASNNDAKRFKCQASAGLSLYAVAGIFMLIFQTICPREVAVYLCLCDLIDCFYYANRGIVSPNELARRVHAFLQVFVDVYGVDHMTPKFHWLLHFPAWLKRFRTLISCFVHERKHKMVKRYANDMRNTRTNFDEHSYEKSIMAEVRFNIFDYAKNLLGCS